MGLDKNRFKGNGGQQRPAPTDWLKRDAPARPVGAPKQGAPTPFGSTQAAASAEIPRWDSLGTSRPAVAPTPVAAQPRPASVAPAFTPQPTPVQKSAPAPLKPSVPASTTAAAEAAPTVSIQISLPTFSPSKLTGPLGKGVRTLSGLATSIVRAPVTLVRRLATLFMKRMLLSTVVLLAVVATGGAGYYFVSHKQTTDAPAAITGAAKSASQKIISRTPTFKPVAPKTEPDLATGKSGITKYDGTHDSYSYQDVFKGQYILVSEQKVPAKFNSAAEAATTIAGQLKANTPISTNHGNAYMATDAKSNSQTIVSVIGGVLIFIQSPFSHNASDWQSYLNNLTQP